MIHYKKANINMVSVLIPVYNIEKYIGRCIESVINQTYKDLEIIVVNDGSTDRSWDIIQGYAQKDTRIKVLNQNNQGLSSVRNTGLNLATGDYLLFVDGDDFLVESAIELLLEKVSKEYADIVVFDFFLAYKKGIRRTYDKISADKDFYIKQLLCRDVQLGVCGKFIARGIFSENNLRFVNGLNYGEDYVTIPRIVYYARKIVKLDLPLYYYVQYNSNSYTSCFTDKHIQNILSAFEILRDFFSKVHDCDKFKPILEECKLRNKIFLLEYCKRYQRKYVLSLFPEVNTQEISLPLKHRIVWILAQKKMYLFLDLYVNIGHIVKKIRSNFV